MSSADLSHCCVGKNEVCSTVSLQEYLSIKSIRENWSCSTWRKKSTKTHTFFRVICMCSLWERAVAGGAPETFPVEVEPLGTDPFNHVDTLGARVALVSRLRKSPSYWTSLETEGSIDFTLVTPDTKKKIFKSLQESAGKGSTVALQDWNLILTWIHGLCDVLNSA